MIDQNYQDEMMWRVEHARRNRRKALKRYLMWRGMHRAGHGTMLLQVCREQMDRCWQDVRYWVQSELYSRGK